jgi:hypothetical protein
MNSSRVILLCGLLLSACAAPKKKESDEKKPTPPVAGPRLVGRIASIPADRRFVLIQSYSKWSEETGKILTTRGPDERTANLRTTGEVMGEFAAADLQSGRVEVGDAVYSQHVVKPVPPPESSEVAVPVIEPVPENVKKIN